MKKIIILIPVYNDWESLKKLIIEISKNIKTLNDFSFELPLFGSALRAALEDPSMSPIYPFR